MSVYKKFEKTDVIQSVLTLTPQFYFVSGTAGWKGNQGVSASISLLDGPRFNQTPGSGMSIRPIFRRDQHDLTGNPVDGTGSYPATSSLKFVTLRPGANQYANHNNWGEEYWSTIENLYSWHSRYNAEYHTASYDYYSVYFAKNSSNIISKSGSSGHLIWDTMSSSFTMEFFVKPFSVTSTSHDFTIASRNGVYNLCITGSTGQLVFSGSAIGIHTASRGPEVGKWSHVVVRGADNTGSFLINLIDAGTFIYAGPMARTQPAYPSPTLGNVFTTPLDAGSTIESGSDASAVGISNRSFHGMMHEARFWAVKRSDTQLSSSYNKVLSDSGSLVAYYRMNQGPLYRSDTDPALYNIGSGVLDHSANLQHLSLRSFSSRRGPVWQPCDNINFHPLKTLAFQSSSLSILKVFNIPSIMYGRQIATGSIEITCRAYSNVNTGLIRVIKDDGRGGLYISGSMFSSSLETKEAYDGTYFNKVGNVFYGEGIIVIKDPSLLDLGAPDGNTSTTSHPNELLSISFKGESSIPTKTLMCRADVGEFNASNNQTYTEVDSVTGKRILVNSEPVTYITAVGLYDEQRRLVAVAKLAQGIRKREKDKLNIKLRIDF